MFTITFNAGTSKETTEVCKPLKVNGEKTLIAFIKGANVQTKWVASSRIQEAA